METCRYEVGQEIVVVRIRAQNRLTSQQRLVTGFAPIQPDVETVININFKKLIVVKHTLRGFGEEGRRYPETGFLAEDSNFDYWSNLWPTCMHAGSDMEWVRYVTDSVRYDAQPADWYEDVCAHVSRLQLAALRQKQRPSAVDTYLEWFKKKLTLETRASLGTKEVDSYGVGTNIQIPYVYWS